MIEIYLVHIILFNIIPSLVVIFIYRALLNKFFFEIYTYFSFFLLIKILRDQ